MFFLLILVLSSSSALCATVNPIADLLAVAQQSQDLKAETLHESWGTIADLVVPYGYPLEQHSVTTNDGFILQVFRIRSKKPSRSRFGGTQAPVVLLMHGLLDSAAGFVLNGPDRALAFILADAGFDVWLGNARGNSYSRSHVRLSEWDSEFWAFSWDEIAALDLPATVDYILNETGASTLSYVGHSQGTTVMLAALSTQPALAQRVTYAVLLAPVATVKHVASLPILALTALGTDGVFTLLGVHEILPSQRVIAFLEGQLCIFQPLLCVNFLTAVCGYNPQNLNTTRLPTYLRYTPAGTSVENMAHWSQGVRAVPNQMQYFDYGLDCNNPRRPGKPCNQMVYGTETAPFYNLSAISTPLALFTGGNDILADPIDVEYLLEALPPGVVRYKHYESEYEHLDFTWGANAADKIYGKVLDLLVEAANGSK